MGPDILFPLMNCLYMLSPFLLCVSNCFVGNICMLGLLILCYMCYNYSFSVFHFLILWKLSFTTFYILYNQICLFFRSSNTESAQVSYVLRLYKHSTFLHLKIHLNC